MDGFARELVLDIYDTVATPAKWGQVLDRLGEHLDARGVAIFELNGMEASRRIDVPFMSGDYDRAQMEAYLGAFHQWELEDHDAFERHSLAADGVDLIDSRALFPAERAPRPHHKVLEQHDIRYRIGCLLDKDNARRGRFTFQFREANREISDADRAMIAALMPHAAKALSLGRPAKDLALAQQGLLAAMDRLTIGVCIMDDGGRIVATNDEFRRQVEAWPLLGMDAAGRLQLGTASAARLFQSMFEDVTQHGRFGARPRKEAIPLGEDPADGALCLELAPLHAVPEMGTRPLGGVILYSLDTSRAVEIDLESVGRAFGLTATEQELAKLISEGLTNAQIAERRTRALDTVRTQVKSVLAKTGSANRTQLVRLLSGFDARWVRD